MTGRSGSWGYATLALLLASALALLGVVLVSSARAADVRLGPGVYLRQAPTGAVLSDPRAGGRSGWEREPRIVGGSQISISQVPWQVAVARSLQFFPGDAYDRQICGGSLVAPTLVITAAHCLVDESSFLPAGAFSAVTERTQLSSSEGQEIGLADYYYFVDALGQPLYDTQTGAWDVALLELAAPSGAQTIKLAGADESQLWSEGRAAYVSGWGAIAENGPYPDFLLGAELVVFPDSYCSLEYPGEFDAATSFCAGTALGERDTCYADSGGPLVVPMADGGFRLVGNTQGGRVCGNPYSPGIYGRLAADPVRATLRDAALEIAGVDIVGSGGRAPSTLTASQARENAWIASDRECARWRICRRYDVGACAARGNGFLCVIINYGKTRRRVKIRCARYTYLTAERGVIERRPEGKWQCYRGW